VKLLGLKRNRLRFQVVKTGREYTYAYHKAAVEPFNQHLALVFGPECDRKGIERLNATDKAGVQSGAAAKGMTKQGVIFAMGYPPKLRTPDLKANEWIYWRNRFNTFQVTFDDKGRVSEIKD
jgi:hypothetical protein